MPVGQWKLQRSLSATNHCSDADAHEAVADDIIKIYDVRQTFFLPFFGMSIFSEEKSEKEISIASRIITH